MDKEVTEILEGYLSAKEISEVEAKLLKTNYIIYRSKLPKLTEEAVLYVDATPDNDYPLRILQVYRQNCNCMWAENINGSEALDPILKAMNEANSKRAEILDKAIKMLIQNTIKRKVRRYR